MIRCPLFHKLFRYSPRLISQKSWAATDTIRFKSTNPHEKDDRKEPQRPPDYEFDKIEPGGWMMLIIPAATLGLGIWQVFRWRWKLGLIDEMEKITKSETLELSKVNLDEANDLEYKSVRVKGRFDSTKDVLLGPRTLVTDKENKPLGLISRKGNTSGYLVLTPFTVSEKDMTIIVNRGWVPSRKVENFRASPEEVEIIGVVRGTEHRAPFMSKNRPESGLWLSRDLPSLAKYFDSSELFLDLTACVNLNEAPDLPADSIPAEIEAPSRPPVPVPVPGQTRVSLRNEHVSYFMTWFSLSGITAYMWVKFFLKKRRLR